ncbi:MAG: pyruvate kinase [Trebonia sp.]|jgi:pyruvate kinase|uniref:pyruvate kinase n=1 Tax=Trebonia sp. TaxID=2767075 RepID=UPI003BB097A7
MSRRAKIVCTLGPATSTQERINALITAGLDVARLNLSHGSHADHLNSYRLVRAGSDAIGRSVGVLADLQGPKIRLGEFPGGPVLLTAGDEFTITTDDIPGDRHEASTTYQGLADDVRAGDRILIDDGNVQVDVTGVAGTRVRTRVAVGGRVSDHKGINLPGVAVSAPALTAKDQEDLRWALATGVDIVAMSFVRGPDDAMVARKIMNEAGRSGVPLIAKIEKPEAVRVLPEIVDAFDGIMVARGDLGVELPLEQVPAVQSRAIALARERARPVIVATQMLESMISAPRPTRAEVSDVAGAVVEGADAVMLSAETSVGAYPVETVATMARIVSAAEDNSLRAEHSLTRMPTTTGGAIARAAAEVGAIVGAKALVAFTMTGETARRLARYRSPVPLLAFTTEPATRSQLALTWGVETFIVPAVRHTDDMVHEVDSALVRLGRCTIGDKIVIVAGSPPGSPGKTNALRVHRIGDAIELPYP